MWSKWLSLFILHLKEINAALDINVVALKWRIRFKNVSIFAFMNGVGHVEFQCKNVRKIKKMSGDVMIILLVKVVENKIFGSGWHYSSQNHYCNNLPTQKKNASMSLRSLIFSKVKGELKKTLHGEEKKLSSSPQPLVLLLLHLSSFRLLFPPSTSLSPPAFLP